MSEKVLAPARGPLMTMDDLCAYLQVKPLSVYKAMADKTHPLPSIKIKGGRRFLPDRIDNWLNDLASK